MIHSELFQNISYLIIANLQILKKYKKFYSQKYNKNPKENSNECD